MSTTRILLSLVFAAAAGAGATAYLSETPPSPLGSPAAPAGASASLRPDTAVDYDRRIAELAAALEHAREERTILTAEVASLKNELARAQSTRPTQVAHAATSADHARNEEKAAAEQGPRPLDVDALVAAGFPEEIVREFKANLDQTELDRLYLRDIATREGWVDTARFREEVEALRLDASSTREEYGEEFYDWMLYTTGHPNRVAVGDVMTGSAAEDIGIRPGDQVLSYDGQRIFSPSELRDATIQGDPGALTPVEVLRNGRYVRLIVPRGPLGIRVERTTVEPPRAS